jgi:hypothetical protein
LFYFIPFFCHSYIYSGIIYGQILGGLMMLTGVIVFCLILYYFLMVITLGTSYRRTSVHDVLDMCYEMQRTDQEARKLKICFQVDIIFVLCNNSFQN